MSTISFSQLQRELEDTYGVHTVLEATKSIQQGSDMTLRQALISWGPRSDVKTDRANFQAFEQRVIEVYQASQVQPQQNTCSPALQAALVVGLVATAALAYGLKS